MIMRTHIRSTRLLVVAVPLLLAGCFKLSRETPPVRYYALGGGTAGATVASAAPAGTPATSRSGLTVGLRRLELASYLSVPEVMVRRGANRLDASEFHRWGGDIDEGINRAVAMYLASAPPVRAVDVAPWPARVRHDFIVQLHVSRFEGVADSAAAEGRVHVLAGWDIIRPLDGAVLMRGSTDDRGGAWRVGDYAGLIAGLDAAVSRVARDISACLARFPNDSTPPASCGSVVGAGGGDR